MSARRNRIEYTYPTRYLKHRLCEIDGNGRTLHLDFSSPLAFIKAVSVWPIMPHRPEESIPSPQGQTGGAVTFPVFLKG